MNTHDVLAYSIATEAVRRLRAGAPPWNGIFSSQGYITSSRAWPVPDFVLVDTVNALSVGVEFKPPQQSKREYVTGLGQAISYARDFHYGLLVVPTVADDGYGIADHLTSVLLEPAMSGLPVGLLAYDPATLSPTNPFFDERHFFSARLSGPSELAPLDSSFYAKWREISPEELFAYISFAYDEARTPSATASNIRDRAFDKLWSKIQSKELHHWAGGIRTYEDTQKNKTAVFKNYRNFAYHLGWSESDGALTKNGLEALHVGSLYGPNSRPFLDSIALSALTDGKHLILFNAITEYQDSLAVIDNEQAWLDGLEFFLENKGLLKRNPARGLAATKNSARQFLKAEKQFWKKLELIIPRGLNQSRVFHPGRGFIFNWARITSLLQKNT